MKWWCLYPVSLLLGVLMQATFCRAAPAYSLDDLGVLTDLSNRTDGQPNAINSLGKVAASNVSNGSYRAFVIDGQWQNLGTLGGPESLCADVNDLGVAVGNSLTAGGLTRGFIWTPGGTDGAPANPQMKDLGTFGGAHSAAYSINSAGQISGYAQTNLEDHAFIRTTGTLKDIGALLGGGLIHSYGLDINVAGHVVGLAYSSSFSVTHAFFYNGTTAVDIGNLGGASASALAINNTDQITGYSANFAGYEHAFRYVNGVMKDLGTLGGSYSYGVGINNSNVVVGGSYIDAGNNTYHAFIYRDTSMQDLNDLLDASGTGWTLTEARAINDSGQITGVGRFGGAKHAFRLNPLSAAPAPTIIRLEFDGGELLLHFTTVATFDYVVEERSNFEGSRWGDVVTAIAGTGDPVTAIITGAAGQAGRFYRIRLSPR